MRTIKNFEWCQNVAEKLSLDPFLVARAFGIAIPEDRSVREKLKELKTQEDRWKLLEKIPFASRAREEVLQAILDNSQSQQERFKVYEESPTVSIVQMNAVEALVKNMG